MTTTPSPQTALVPTETPQVIAHQQRVAIVGFAESSVGQAPYQDDTWDIWGLNQLWQQIPRWSLWFDLHPRYMIDRHPQHVAWMQQQQQPILMQQHYADIPSSVPFPKQELVTHFGDYFTSTIAWMLALAIAQGYQQIGVWGVDMLGDGEYEYQRACCDYLIGYARGQGIAVHVADDSALCKGPGLYGYEWLPHKDARPLRRIKKRKRYLQAEKDKALRVIYQTDGAIDELTIWEDGKGEEAKTARLKALRDERERVMQHLYSVDGAMQELEHTLQYEKHYARGGA